jgi:hypothetical protein
MVNSNSSIPSMRAREFFGWRGFARDGENNCGNCRYFDGRYKRPFG